MPVLRIRDAELYYEIHGDGPPLLLIAGMGGVGGYWKPQVEYFARNYKTIVYDQRGTGRSSLTKSAYSVALLADDAMQLLDELGIEKVSLCGHSTGGMMAQNMALAHPERLNCMVVYASRGHADAFTRRAMGLRRKLLLDGKVEEFVRSTALFLYPSWWIVANNDTLVRNEDAAIAAFSDSEIMASRIQAVLDHDQLENLPKISTPTLVTCAKDDFLTPTYYSEEMHRLIPGARLEFVSKGGHACSLTNPAEFNSIVERFLGQHAS